MPSKKKQKLNILLRSFEPNADMISADPNIFQPVRFTSASGDEVLGSARGVNMAISSLLKYRWFSSILILIQILIHGVLEFRWLRFGSRKDQIYRGMKTASAEQVFASFFLSDFEFRLKLPKSMI